MNKIICQAYATHGCESQLGSHRNSFALDKIIMNENVRPIGGPTASSMHLTDQDWIVRKLWFMFNPLDKSKVFPPLDIGVAARARQSLLLGSGV